MFEHLEPGDLFSMRYIGLLTHELNKDRVPGVSQMPGSGVHFDRQHARGKLVNSKRVTFAYTKSTTRTGRSPSVTPTTMP